MAIFNQTKRWELIISLVRQRPYISKKQLIERMEEDYEIVFSPRTLERDLRKLASEFGVYISYDRQEKGYFIAEHDQDYVVHFLQFAGRIFLGSLFRDALKDFEKLHNQVKPEDYSDYKGVMHLHPILLALRNHLKIEFTYENFIRNTKTFYRITPLQLREYGRRWYVVGVPEGLLETRIFGLSRITNLRTGGLAKINIQDYEEQLKKFDRVIGLNYDAHTRTEMVHLAVTPTQYKYLKSLPLHRTQKEEARLADGRFEISFYLIPNQEFVMQLLKLGDQIEVLKPKFLRDEIREVLSKSLKRYEENFYEN